MAEQTKNSTVAAGDLNKIEMGTAHLANPDREVFRGSALIFDEKGF